MWRSQLGRDTTTSRRTECELVAITVNLLLIDRGFALHRKAHGHKSTDRDYLQPAQPAVSANAALTARAASVSSQRSSSSFIHCRCK